MISPGVSMSSSTGVDRISRQRRWMAVVAITGFASAYTLFRGVWPEIYTFATDPGAALIARLLAAPVHLADDVMLTLRSGEILLESGLPAFNRTDVAQAATSYFAPYIFAGFRLVLPFNAAVILFGVLGFAAVVATYGVIAGYSRSVINGALLVAALTLTTTNLEFALNGWDHLLQGAVFAAAIVLALRTELTLGRLLTLSVLAALGSLLRPDGIIIGLAILVVALMRSRAHIRRAFLPATTPFLVVMGVVLGINWLQFGYLTPTTARLKAGGAPSGAYIRDYLFANGVASYTALSLTIILGVVSLLFFRRLPVLLAAPLFFAAGATAVVAALNSDFFPGARMFWVPAVVLSTMLAVLLPGLLRSGPAFPHDENERIRTQTSLPVQWFSVITLVAVALSFSALFGVRGAVISKESLANSRTAEQFLATQWIRATLSPTDGSVGVFFGGEAAHVLDFEAADFLGKADELIASTPIIWGPPGHNKWNIEASLRKWRPQVILPTIDQDPRDPSADVLATEWRERKWTHGYVADLITDPTIRSDYRYCRVPDPTGRVSNTVDVLLRVDIVERLAGAIECG